jgi:4-hydroxy-3-methylbut-2-en-1-yl diphosphate reductase
MRVIEADHLGMCFGVRDALARIEKIRDPSSVTIYGELVHNEAVKDDLRRRGFRSQTEADRDIPSTDRVLVTAHGLSDREKRGLQAAGKDVIDTTCPLVRRAHRAGLDLAAEGRHVVVIGRHGHVEVRGLTGDLEDVTVVATPEEARFLDRNRIGVIAQTTTRDETAAAILAELSRWNPGADIRVIDTICRPTRQRQEAVARLLEIVDALVVVGGRNSNNTRALVERARREGIRARHVTDVEDLPIDWFAGVETVGLTAGTSTPAGRVAEVRLALTTMAHRLPVLCASGGS